MRPRLEVAEIFCRYEQHYRKRYPVTFAQNKVIGAITRCRTAALGGHLYQCDSCGKKEVSYNSCRNRHCPKCQGSSAAKWVEKRSAELLPCAYFHTVFTLPHQFQRLVLENRGLMYELLFRAVKDTLLQIGKRNFGMQLGFMAILHSWGQLLELHPHLHVVIPSLGLTLARKEVKRLTHSRYFISDKILSLVFCGKFISYLKHAYRKGKLSLAGELAYLADPQQFELLLNCATRKRWVVRTKPPFAGPAVVLKYLSRYTHRVAIANSRLLELKDDRVYFSYKDYRNGCAQKITSLDAVHFIRRFLLHTLPKAFVRIRHFGFLANATKQQALNLLMPAPKSLCTAPSAASHQAKCPACGRGLMTLIAEFAALPLGITSYYDSS